MKYPINADEIYLYDMVECDGIIGKIVAIIDDGIYSNEYCSNDWSYLKNGILIYSKEFGLIHYTDLPNDISLMYRSRSLHE